MRRATMLVIRRWLVSSSICAVGALVAGCTQTLRWVNSTRTAPGDLFDVAATAAPASSTPSSATNQWGGTNADGETYVTVKVIEVGGLPLYAAPNSDAFLWASATVPYNAGANQFASSSLFADRIHFTVPGHASVPPNANIVIRNRPTVVMTTNQSSTQTSTQSLPLQLRFALLDPSTGRVPVDPVELPLSAKNDVQQWALPDSKLLAAQIEQFRQTAAVLQESDQRRTNWKGILSLTSDAASGQWTKLATGLDSALRVFSAQLIPIQHVAFDLSGQALPAGSVRVPVGTGPASDPYVRYRYAVVAEPATIRQVERRVIAKASALGKPSVLPEAGLPTDVTDPSSQKCDGTKAYVREVIRQAAPPSPVIECGFVVLEVELRPSVLPSWAPGLVYALRCDLDQEATPPNVTFIEARGGKACPARPAAAAADPARFSARTALVGVLSTQDLGPSGSAYAWYSRADLKMMYSAVGLDWVIDSLASLRDRAENGHARVDDDLYLTMLTGFVTQAAKGLDDAPERRLTHEDNLLLGDILRESARAYLVHVKRWRAANEADLRVAAQLSRIPSVVIGLDSVATVSDEAALKAIVDARVRNNALKASPIAVKDLLRDSDISKALQEGNMSDVLTRIRQRQPNMQLLQQSTPKVPR